MISVYFQVLLFSFIIPLLFSFHPKIKFYKKWPEFIKANLIITIPFLIWDEIFTNNNVWGFNAEHISGFYILNLPVEEILFFIIIPYCCVFTYEAIKMLPLKNNEFVQPLTLILAISMLFLGMISFQHIYSLITFILLGLLLITLFFLKKDFMTAFYITYAVITVSAFLLINGVLTGGTLENPPVWYNNAENLNIRIWTIPIEDFFYSMLLLLSNIWLFEEFSSKTNTNHE